MEKHEHEDGSLTLVENNPRCDTLMFKFGPCLISLCELIDKGYWLESYITKYRKNNPHLKSKLRLSDGKEFYVIGKIRTEYILGCEDLSSIIKSFGINGHKVVSHIPIPIQSDPMELLLEKYPRHCKPQMIGNQTVGEYIKGSLRSLKYA